MNSIDKNKEVADTIMTAVNCFFDERKAVEHMTRESTGRSNRLSPVYVCGG